jgi:hypothetical protein
MADLQAGYEIDPLTRLAIKYGTDKWGFHFYTPIYHDLFSRLRDQAVRLLEIGVGGYELATIGGASLQMWAEYFPQGQITGIDIAEKKLILSPRVKLFRGSQIDPVFLKKVCDERGPFDVIIDDGSHVPKHVVSSFNILFPSLVDGGMYVIEDVQTAFWPKFGGSSDGGETLQLTKTIIECLNHADIAVVEPARLFPSFAREIRMFRAFHCLFVIDKGKNGEPSNAAFDANNPHTARAISAIERQLETAPTVEGLANLANLYSNAGDQTKAKAIADRALSRWPGNAAALMAAYSAAKRRNDKLAQIDYLDRLLHIEPENAALQGMLARVRAELNQ